MLANNDTREILLLDFNLLKLRNLLKYNERRSARNISEESKNGCMVTSKIIWFLEILEKMAFNGFMFKQTSIVTTGIDPTIMIHFSP